MANSVKSPVLTMRILKYAMVVSCCLFVYIAFTIPAQPGPPASPQFEVAIAVVGIASVIAGFVLPRIIVQTFNPTPRGTATQAEFQRWFSKGVISLAFFEACVLFGFVLHILHGRTWLVDFLFALGIAAELIWSPGPPPSAENSEFPPSQP